MKPLIVMMSLVTTNVMALDFDKEWSKFESDFAKLKSSKTIVLPTPVVSKVNDLVEVDPRSPDRLGHTISDPVLKKRVTELYKKPDTVVYSLTLSE